MRGKACHDCNTSQETRETQRFQNVVLAICVRVFKLLHLVFACIRHSAETAEAFMLICQEFFVSLPNTAHIFQNLAHLLFFNYATSGEIAVICS